ncbi:Quinol monooxygenase YgiN [Pedobacter westerhofensis]|uniref:Quinol monooxygenase YgiN n=2 Tax=Pedobacter westerhofensis TaxID=425512 RepID=A0A521FK82_9SPHI|nr:antibiotic biosynthesis monooxygenase family protein [Pedobacter westerhofensis]SMO96575.1 Quinol monooxygenase YgiN [Pedobacter westerhofensis]
MKSLTTIKFLLICLAILMASHQQSKAQLSAKKVRIARLEIYPEYLEAYKVALAEHAAAAVKSEPGVLALQAVYDKAHPAQVTVFEMYASENAYQAHLKAPHFLKYKNGTLKMVKTLELIETEPIAIEIKPVLTEMRSNK